MIKQILRRLFGLELTVSGVMSDFQAKINQLKQVAEYQRLKAGKEAAKIEKAIKAQDKAQSEVHDAERTIESLQAITSQTKQLSLADFKKEVK